MRKFFVMSLIILLFNQAIAMQLSAPTLSSIAITTATKPVIAPLSQLAISRNKYKIPEQRLSDEQIIELSRDSLQFLQTPEAFDYQIRLDGHSLCQHILKYHVALNNIIPEEIDVDADQEKTYFISKTATGADIIAMLQKKIKATTIEQCRLAYYIRDGILYLTIQIPVATDNLRYYEYGAQLPCQYICIGIKKVWLNNRWSNTLGASTIYPTNQLKVNSQIINLITPTEELTTEYRILEKSYSNHQVMLVFNQPSKKTVQHPTQSADAKYFEQDSKLDQLKDLLNIEYASNHQDTSSPKTTVIQPAPESKKNIRYYLYSNGDQYQGEWFEDTLNNMFRPHGIGTMTYSNGSSYTGAWQLGKGHGQGEMTYKYPTDGISIIAGHWHNDTIDETKPVTITYTDQRVFSGTIKNGAPQEGTMSHYPPNTIIAGGAVASCTGTWENHQLIAGTIVFSDHPYATTSTAYRGELKNGAPHGKGEFFLTSTEGINQVQDATKIKTCLCQWENGQPTTGTITYLNGATYIGKIHNFKPHGPGMKKEYNGMIYNGLWEYGYFKQSPNQAVERIINIAKPFNDSGIPSFYQGEALANDLRHGYGTIRYSDGSTYTGCWYRNHKQGKGRVTYTYPERTKGIQSIDCNWDNDMINSQQPAIVTYQNGSVFIGSLTGSIQNPALTNSKGKLILANADSYEGNFTNGKLDGPAVITHANGDITKGMFNQSKRTGTFTTTKVNGEIIITVWQDGEQIKSK